MNRNVKNFLIKLKSLFSNKNFINILVLFFIVISIVIIGSVILDKYLRRKRKKTDVLVKMSSYHKGSSGTTALRELFENFNYKISKIVEPFRRDYDEKKISHINTLRLTKPSVVLLIEPEKEISIKDIEKIEAACNYGFNIIILTENKYLLDKIITHKDNSEKNTGNFLSSTNPLVNFKNKDIRVEIKYDKYKIMNEVNKIKVNNGYRFNKKNKNWEVIIKDEFGPLIIEKKYNKGVLVLGSISRFTSNLDIRNDDNGLFIFRLTEKYIKNNIIYFNEYYHGIQKKYTFLYFIAKKEFSLIFLQIIIIFICLVLALGIKFGTFQKKIILSKKVQITHYSESMSNLLSKRRFVFDIANKIIHNFKKMNNTAVKSDTEKLKKIEELQKYINNEGAKIKHIKRLYNIIKE